MFHSLGTIHKTNVFCVDSDVYLEPDGTIHSNNEIVDKTWEDNKGQTVFRDRDGRLSTVFHKSYPWGRVGTSMSNPRKRRFLSAVPASVDLRYVIATCRKYQESTIPKLLASLEEQNIPKNITYVVVGDSEEAKEVTQDGIRYMYLKENCWEYVALLALSRNTTEPDDSYWFLLHDTLDVGPDFHRLSPQLNTTFNPEVVWASIEHAPGKIHSWCNIGAYRLSFLRRNNKKFEEIRAVSKDLGVSIELNKKKLGIIEWASRVGSYSNYHSYRQDKLFRYEGKLRSMRHYPSVDIYKYWAQYDPRYPDQSPFALKGGSTDMPLTYAIVTTCKGRLHHLKETLPKMRKLTTPSGNPKIYIVSYGDPEVIEWAKSIKCGTVVCVKDNTEFFDPSRARNCGGKASGEDILCFVDADMHLTQAWMDEVVKSMESGNSLVKFPLGSSEKYGTCAVTKKAFAQVRGFDETLKGWGHQDHDFYKRVERLCPKGVVDLPADIVTVIPQEHEERVANYENKEMASYGKPASNNVNALKSRDRERVVNPEVYGIFKGDVLVLS